jgi:hypothetical protein
METPGIELNTRLKTFNGIPIYVVRGEENNSIPKTFMAGVYGLDTESDYRNNQLRLIQIYDGKIVYIFSAEYLLPNANCALTKFMTSKDRIKVGVDIDGDLNKLRNFIDKRWRECRKGNPEYNPYKLNANGFVDLQSIARSLGERAISLEKLADKYVENFQGNPTLLSTYLDPTDEDYIYAANDAVLSLEIYKPLLERRVTKRWQNRKDKEVLDEIEERKLFLEWIEPQLERTRSVDALINFAVNSYGRWHESFDNSEKAKRAKEYIESMDLETDSTSSSEEDENKQLIIQLNSCNVDVEYKNSILEKIKLKLKRKLNEEEVKLIKLFFQKDLYYDLLLREFQKSMKYSIKDRSWFVKQFSALCSTWKRRFETNIILRSRLADLFFDLAVFKGDIVIAGDDLYEMKTK